MTYCARVELHDALPTDYPNLHLFMAVEGFGTTVFAATGRAYRLPPGTYSTTQAPDASAAYSAAARAARKTGRRWSIVITSGPLIFDGLDPVRPDPVDVSLVAWARWRQRMAG